MAEHALRYTTETDAALGQLRRETGQGGCRRGVQRDPMRTEAVRERSTRAQRPFDVPVGRSFDIADLEPVADLEPHASAVELTTRLPANDL